jgi:hypothetical protein
VRCHHVELHLVRPETQRRTCLVRPHMSNKHCIGERGCGSPSISSGGSSSTRDRASSRSNWALGSTLTELSQPLEAARVRLCLPSFPHESIVRPNSIGEHRWSAPQRSRRERCRGESPVPFMSMVRPRLECLSSACHCEITGQRPPKLQQKKQDEPTPTAVCPADRIPVAVSRASLEYAV